MLQDTIQRCQRWTPRYINLTLKQLYYIENNLKPNKGYAFGVLPYVTADQKEMTDSIAKTMNFRKWYRGPRHGTDCTLKADATGVALYNKP